MLFVLTGPESSGKSALTEKLADHLTAPAIAEVARTYLQTRSIYLPSDLLEIARQQAKAEAAAQVRSQLAVADTDLQVVYIWWQERFGPVPESLSHAYRQQTRRHYLLCRPDIPWTPDPLRENPHDRERLFDCYLEDLERRNLAYSIVEGEDDHRLENAIKAVTAVLS